MSWYIQNVFIGMDMSIHEKNKMLFRESSTSYMDARVMTFEDFLVEVWKKGKC